MRATAVINGFAIFATLLAGPFVRAASECKPGTLVSSAPYLPSSVLLLPGGAGLLVVDRGALTVCDPATLAVRRTLLPTMNGWRQAYVSPDGAMVQAETVDGLRFMFDTASWNATRLADDRTVLPREQFHREETMWSDLRLQGVAALTHSEALFWQEQGPRLGLPALLDGLEATAVVHGIMRTREGKTVLEPLDPVAPGDDPTVFRLVVADTAGVLHLYGDTMELKVSRALAGARIVRLDISGQRILAALATGEVVLLDPELVVEARAMVLPTNPGRSTVGVRRVPLSPPERNESRHGIMSMQYDPGSGRLTWVSTAHAVGVFDLRAGRLVAQVQGTGIALVDALFVDEQHVAVLTDDGVSIRDVADGNLLGAHKGEYLSLFKVGGGLLAITPDGAGDLLDRATLGVRRRVCFLVQGCAEPPLTRPDGIAEKDWKPLSNETKQRFIEAMKPKEQRGFEAAARRVRAVPSPDGRSLAVLQQPIEVGDRKSPGAISVWDLQTVARRRSVALKDCYRWEIGYLGARVLEVCGDQRRDAGTLARLPPASKQPDHGHPIPGEPDLIAVRRGTIEIAHARGAGGDFVRVVDGDDKLLLELARPEIKANPPEYQVPDQERAQLRSQTVAAAAPSGRRFLLAGRGLGEFSVLPGLAGVAGPLQVWCTPTRPIADATLPPPPEPTRGDFDGVTELALEGFPDKIVSAAEVGSGAVLLGTNLKGDVPLLVAVDGATGRLTPQSLPAGGPWERLLPSPQGDTVWLQSKTAVARRDLAGRWTTFALGQGSTQFFAPLSATTAVHVARRTCRPDELAAAQAEPNLRAFYAHNRRRLTIPAQVTGSKIELMIDAQGPDDEAAHQSLRRRAEAVAALLAAPGASFATVQSRAIKDPQINASSDTRFTIAEGRLSEADRPLARLFSAPPGQVVGPLSSKSTDGFRRSERLLVRFVRVERIVPEAVRPFAELTQAVAAGQWYVVSDSVGECADVNVLGDPKTVPRTVLPPHGAREFVSWRGGFAAPGNPLLVFRDGAWVSPTSPLALAIGALRPGEGSLAAGTSVYVRGPNGVQVIDVATGKTARNVALDEHVSPKTVQASPTGGETFWVTGPGESNGTLLAVDAGGHARTLGPAVGPLWATSTVPGPVAGRTAQYWTTEVALLRRDGTKWTAMFNPAARNRGLALRRQMGD